MRIVQLNIERFRGIREMDWKIDGGFLCFIGSGDSTKSTILDAIELVISPRWNPPFDDSDFYNGETSEPIKITATVIGFPERLLKDSKFGLDLRGWKSSGGLQDEPDDECEPALSIRLYVDSSLEPVWRVMNDRNIDGRPISAKDRESLGGVRLGSFVDRHFNWSSGTALARLTSEPEGLSVTLAEARRVARQTLNLDEVAELKAAATKAQELGADIGVAAVTEYRPHLDTKAFLIGAGSLALHDGEVPVRRAGLGSRRLLTMALQRESAKKGGVTLIDEVESGLEPHRIRRVLRVLRKKPEDGIEGEKTEPNQVFMTTHSPTVLRELVSSELVVIRSRDGKTVTQTVDPALQPIIRKSPEAFLGRKVLVCEGKTEIGFCRALDTAWSDQEESFAFLGVVLSDGNGTEAPSIASKIASLGYDVALFGDSDTPLEPTPEAMVESGVSLFLWAGEISIEQRVAIDIPWAGLIEILNIAVEELGEGSVKEKIGKQLEIEPSQVMIESSNITVNGFSQTDLRTAIGSAAMKRKSWFKRVDLAEKLGDVVMKYFGQLDENSDLCKKIIALREWTRDQ